MLVIVVVLFCVAWFPLQMYNVLQVNINGVYYPLPDKTNIEGEKGRAITQLMYLLAFFFLRYVLQVTWPEVNEYQHINIIWLCFDWLAMSNSCYNPFIYGIYNVSRQTYLRRQGDTLPWVIRD